MTKYGIPLASVPEDCAATICSCFIWVSARISAMKQWLGSWGRERYRKRRAASYRRRGRRRGPRTSRRRHIQRRTLTQLAVRASSVRLLVAKFLGLRLEHLELL